MCYGYRELSSADVKVRKPHLCAWCAERILKSASARARSYVFDGELISDWMHPECFDAMGEAEHDVICDGWMPGDFPRGAVCET